MLTYLLSVSGTTSNNSTPVLSHGDCSFISLFQILRCAGHGQIGAHQKVLGVLVHSTRTSAIPAISPQDKICLDTKKKVCARNNIIRRLTSTAWVPHLETPVHNLFSVLHVV